MYKAKDVCKYIVFYSNEHNYTISNLRLQKILFFVQLYFLKIRKQACFAEDIEAWDFGPVVPEVYREYMKFGLGQIMDFRNPNVSFEIPLDQQIIDGVIDLLAPYTNTELVALSIRHPVYERAHGGTITLDKMNRWIKEKETKK